MKALVFVWLDRPETIHFNQQEGEWLEQLLPLLSISDNKQLTINNLKDNFEEKIPDFRLFWFSKSMEKMKENGLIVI